MKVYLIRHAQCEINALLDNAPRTQRLSRSDFNELLRGETTSPLTIRGKPNNAGTRGKVRKSNRKK
jgi:hypothetical protein